MIENSDRTILVTGATDGLGRALAERIAKTGATVLLHGRSQDRGEQTLEAIAKSSGNNHLHYYNADFADLQQVADAAALIQKNHQRLDVLVNNAGIGGRTGRQESRQGIELRFAVNYLAGYFLTRELYPLLETTAARSTSTRIVNVSSIGQSPIDFDDVMMQNSYEDFRAYTQSKLAQIMMTFDLAQHFATTRVAATALHPSTFMPTKMVAEMGATPMSTVEDGLQATFQLTDSLSNEQINGEFFDVNRNARAHDQAYDARARLQLKELSEKLIKQSGL